MASGGAVAARAGERGAVREAGAGSRVATAGDLGRFAALLLLAATLLHGLTASPAAAQPADLSSWLTVRSAHFEVHSNAERERAVEIVASLERLRAVFAGVAREIDLQSPAPTRIFAFRDAESFAPYRTAEASADVRVLGQFLSHRDGNYIVLDADPAQLGAFPVIFHEYVHYLVKSNFPGVPTWFNEGLAEYYSSFLVDGEVAFVGQPVSRHMSWLARNAELGIDEVLAVTREEAGGHDAHAAGRFYAVSWALVHYLLSDRTDRSGELASYFAALARGAPAAGAFVDAFGIRPSELEETLRAYVRNGELPVASYRLDRLRAAEDLEVAAADPAAVLTDLGILLGHMGREEEAARHLLAALDHDPESGDAWAGLGYVRDRQQRLEEAHQHFAEAVERVPRDATSYLLYGRHLATLAGGGGLAGDGSDVEALAAGARAAFATAVEVDPSFGEARAMRGIAELLAGGDPSAGIPHLERAVELLPGRVDLMQQLVGLYARAGDERRARALAEGALARIADPEAVATAEEEIERWGLIRAADEALAAGAAEEALRLFDQAISVTSDPELRARMEERLTELQEKLEDD